LGSRSILGDARNPAMQSLMNMKIKFRESFRPFAPAVLEEDADDWFDWPSGRESPYMVFVAPVARSHRSEHEGSQARGLDKLRTIHSDIPAVTHVDWSARLQTVDPDRHGRFRRLVERFRDETGCSVIINTSFNVRGEPIVCTPDDAYRCFMATDIDALVLEDVVLLKRDQRSAHQIDTQQYLERLVPD
jgi:carbamoyltransferase